MTNNNPTNNKLTALLPGDNPYIYGLHDKGGEHLMLVDGEAKGWVLVVEAIGGGPPQTGSGDFTDLTEQGFGVLVRLNQSFDLSGTIPLEENYPEFAQQVADFVEISRGAHRWIIGNEMNLEREQPRREDTGQPEPITPRRYARCYNMCRDAIQALAGSFPLLIFVFNLGTLGIVWVGGNMVIGQQLSLGELVAFMTYLNFMMFPMMMLGMLSVMTARAAASARRIFEILDAEVEIADSPDAIPLPPVQGRVEFEDVSFRYLGADHDTLSHVSFRAEPGQTVAVLGATGSGKSTIINLIPRFYDVTGGKVMVDGHDVRRLTLDSLRSQIGIVLQETVLFSGTIRENIAYGRPEASQAEIEAVARAAQAHDFITATDDGYDTLVGERGVGLSGGQRQRIAIARALLLDPRILILDDSTSSVDAQTEYQIQQALDDLMKGRTSFVIAQRISTVHQADLILVLDEGRLAASGTHRQLLAENEIYAEIVQSQLRQDVTVAGEKTADA
jgi:ATP-binding cassette subfamily B protein